ncbi:hypothetical protein AB0K60_24560 [Thermopolyspora sp. NPDC052614]|uniref:RraA family protein n=1 Tax=Thermopolyspora sp. NPDC052614 TaxID=3155682 RepID=UPI00341303AD
MPTGTRQPSRTIALGGGGVVIETPNPGGPDSPLFAAVGVASVVDAMAERGADGIIEGPRSILGSGVFIGPAVTIRFGEPAPDGPQDAQEVWKVVDGAAAGSVLVLAADGDEISTLGGVTAGTAAARRLAGALTNGLIRDTDEIEGYGFPVRYRRAHPRAFRGSCRGTGVPVLIGGVEISPGDLIVSDRDGAVRVPRADAAAVMERAYAIENLERLWVDHARAYRSIAAGYQEVARRFGSPH